MEPQGSIPTRLTLIKVAGSWAGLEEQVGDDFFAAQAEAAEGGGSLYGQDLART